MGANIRIIIIHKQEGMQGSHMVWGTMVDMHQVIWILTTCSREQVERFNPTHFKMKNPIKRVENGAAMDGITDFNNSNNSSLLACREAKQTPTTMLDGRIKPEAGVVGLVGKEAEGVRSRLPHLIQKCTNA